MIDLRLDIPHAGRTAQLELVLPEWRHVGVRVSRDSGASHWDLRIALGRFVERIDGKRLTSERMAALLADPIAVAAILHHRYKLHESLRAMGRVFAQCPHCTEGEVEMSLLGFFNTVGQLSPPMISEDFIHFMPPALSIGGPDEPRRWAGLTFACRLRFELPSKIAGLPSKGFTSGVMNPISSERVVEAREKWELDGMTVDPPAWWSERNPCYKATIAMFVGVSDTDVPVTTPEIFANMPAYDVYFLDAAYWYAHWAQIPEHAAERTCPTCAKTFLPLQWGAVP